MYELVEEATKVLREPTSEFDFENPPECPKEVEKNLSEAMERFGGIGLSANQLGLDYRVFVMRTADSGIKAFFNPEVTKLSKETEMMKEGCLSFPDIYLMIKRPKAIEFEYTDSDGERHTLQLEGLGSRCVQHELDHLNGIIFLQRASRFKIERALKARPKERKKRLNYERRMEIARQLQSIQSQADSDTDTGGVQESDKVAQES
jgi:peptide deformylase|tara:strand:+ start:152 stop:766 length:615 start_codon:yes stop_codon:yes gene_type:complete